jgi:transcriptional regulator with AAA-type ATPase domain/predicted ATPase
VDALSHLLGESPQILAIRERVRRLLDRWSGARRPPPVLIRGETGTGKGLLASLVHRSSVRADQPLVSINCAAVPETLIESELFGYERGAFTDARQRKPGLFQQAHRGTLFLDEVGLLTASAQAKLLAALEEGAVRRLGSTRSEPVDVWIIAATNEDLDERKFRPDLFHRLAVFTLTLPPLRTLQADILLLAEHFLAQTCADYRLPPLRFAADARAALLSYKWPGNARELANVIERAGLLAEVAELTAADLALPVTEAPPSPPANSAGPAGQPAGHSPSDLAELECALEETAWNVTRAARRLGVTRNTVRARIARAGLRRPDDAANPPDANPVSAATVGPSSTSSRAAHWEPRRLTFLRVQVVGGDDIAPVPVTTLDSVADKLRDFRGRIEGESPRGLLAVFGIEPADEPTLIAGHGALAIQHAARVAHPHTGVVPLVVGMHTEEIPVRDPDGKAVLDADAARRVWTMLDRALERAGECGIVATSVAAALLRRRFDLTPLGSEAGLYRVDGLRRRSRGPMVGRREELALLTSRLATAAAGRGQVVEIVGEAGIGKSRLLGELLGGPSTPSVRYLEARCLPAEIRTPFYPILEIARAACGITEVDDAQVVRQKIEGVGAELQYLLGDFTEPPEPPGPDLTKRLFRALQRLFVELSRRQPLAIVIEDLHWIDPTSEAWLAGFSDSVLTAALLLVVTYRSEYRPPWSGRPEGLRLALAPLAPAESLTLIRGVLDPRTSKEQLEKSIQAKAEGNPLFLEELSLAALERGDGTLPEGIPSTVEDTVASRLARLEGRQRRVLQAAAVLGREFSPALLQHVCQLPEEDLQAMLRQFQRSDFLLESSLGESRWTFKHALVQEAAYAGLPRAVRGDLHLRTVEAIEKLYSERIFDFAEWLAHHATRGDDMSRATRYLLLAGQKSAARSALDEAAGHLRRALELLPALPESPERHRQELELEVALGNVLRTSKGSAAPETERAYARARELLRQVGDPAHVGPALVGEWSSHLLRARYGEAQIAAEAVFSLSDREGDPLLRALGHRGLGMTALYRGDFLGVRKHLEQGIAVYRPEAHHSRAVAEYGIDPHIGCLAYLGRALWCLGYPEQALARNRQAVSEAEAWGGALGVAIARGMLTSIHQLRGEVAETLDASRRAIAHAEDWGVTYWQAQSAVLQAWAEAESLSDQDPARRLADARRSLEQYRATGTRLALTWLLILLAETCRASGAAREGLQAIEEALAHANETGERYHEAEIHRLKGELLLAEDGVQAAPAARHCFIQAIEVAQRQEAKSWELRASTSLARLLQREQRYDEARAVLGPVCEWFTEGFATADFRDARAVLEARPIP